MKMEIKAETDYPAEDVPRVLVIDDEERIRGACQLVLEESGYDVSLAANGIQGLEQLKLEHYDIVLLDLMMPSLSGFDVLAEVKSIHPDTVVIVITGYATLEHSVEAMKKGAFDFIPKPFTPEHLRITVAKALTHIRTLYDIAETRSRIRAMVNRLSDGVMCTNRENRIVLANPAFLRMIGRSVEPVSGLLVDEVVIIDPLRTMVGSVLETAPEAFAEQSREFTLTEEDTGKEKIISARCAPFRDRRERNLGVITVLHDITALKQIDRMKSEFVSMVSHEIRGPMNSVQMQLQVVLDGLAGELTQEQRGILERASGKIGSLCQMTSELLDLARIESGLTSLERERVDMTELIRDQVALHGPRAADAGIGMEMDLPATLPPLLGHRRSLEEVLSNLITNAIKYTPAGGQIRVSARVKQNYVCIEVRDTGLGIANEDQKRIFQRFYRVKNVQTRQIQGTGLGLSLVKKIVNAHQGSIRVESQPGVGSTFFIDLPMNSDGDLII
jgi:two-component system, OmpR family, phosphate regulon sensor histidine kinase PhoR